MTKLSSVQIERLAVDAVISKANHPTACLIPNISAGDKGISFDGEIIVNKDNTSSVKSFIGKVPVQVKGKQVTEFTVGNLMYNLQLKHLHNYYKHGGILYLVVELKYDTSKIYYKHLLPQELSAILKIYGEKKNQESRIIELRALEETSLKSVCHKFLEVQKQQPLILIESAKYQEVSFDSYSVQSLTYDPSNEATSNIFDHDFTIYGIDQDLLVPLNLGRIAEIRNSEETKINLGGKTYSFNVKTTRKEQSYIGDFDDAFRIVYDSKTNQLTFSLLNFVSLTAQLKALEYITAWFYESQQFLLKDNPGLLQNPKIIQWLETINRLHGLMLDIQRIYVAFNVPEDLIIEQLDPTKNIFEQFEYLVQTFLQDNLNGFDIFEENNSRIIKYNVGNKCFLLYYQPTEQKKLINAFSPEIITALVQVQDNESNMLYTHSFYLFLDLESLSYGVNLNFQLIKESFDKFDPFDNQLVSNITTAFYLRCIKAYDISKREELLDIAEHILDKYYIISPHNLFSFDEAVIKINTLQIKIRKSIPFSESDIEVLVHLKNKFLFTEYIGLHFCCNVLLKNKVEAKYTYQKLPVNIQEEFSQLPIYTLYDELLNE
ncbi:DUF4365 domain-containing protein [Paenibacillus sp. Leaf72]|uniref:DUF4365 domain-containing protein n=1 Tax=Paenibacillus sp. Leaf72 TaxID=1736234 RepID=UPI0006F31E3D|nr:DUF4365 domain-containing protein [Paenibacillus sp. Leaf72]KQO18052.1 hypothetical protein ASF12_05245 [Paenibacillus sp. Leaf72]